MARVAVLADTSLQRHILQHTLALQGYDVVINTDPRQLGKQEFLQVSTDIWLVSLLLAEAHCCTVLEFLYDTETPVLFGEGQAPKRGTEDYLRWQRCLYNKLEKQLCDLPVQPPAYRQQERTHKDSNVLQERLALPEALSQFRVKQRQPAQEVWLLAASLGGPAAVKEFLDALPGGLPVGFIYAQHIDQSFEEKLPQAVGRHSEWPVRLAQHQDFVYSGEVVVVPVQNELAFSEGGKMNILERGWNGLYSPCVDQVAHNLTQRFAQRSGVIVFSGMGQDGSQACAYANRQGAPIWAQTASTCVCPSMPDSVRNTGLSVYTASPRGLAVAMLNHLLRRHACQTTRSN